MVSSKLKRATFINNVINFLRLNKMDGIDLDWEYPGKESGEFLKCHDSGHFYMYAMTEGIDHSTRISMGYTNLFVLSIQGRKIKERRKRRRSNSRNSSRRFERRSMRNRRERLASVSFCQPQWQPENPESIKGKPEA